FVYYFFFSSRRRHTRSTRDWSSDVCSSDLIGEIDHDTLRRGIVADRVAHEAGAHEDIGRRASYQRDGRDPRIENPGEYIDARQADRKSTRLNSSHEWISYAVFCLKKKNNNI